MRRRVGLALVLSLSLSGMAVGGCGTSNPGGGGDGGGIDGGAGGSGGDGGGVSGDDDAVTFTLGSFTVPPKGEIYKCQEFANPWGVDTEVSTFESHMSAGSHHLLVFYKSGVANGPLVDCSGLEFAATPYGSQRPDDSVAFPDKVAALVPAGQGFRLQVHYLNATANPISPTVKVTMKRATPGTITDHAGVFFFLNPIISVPSDGQPHSQFQTCTFPLDVNVILANSHMHKHATDFQAATSTGTMIYQTTDWDEPTPAAFAPPLALAKGTQVTYHCTWVNNSGKTLTFGESAETDEMCIFSGQFYPIQGTQSILGCR